MAVLGGAALGCSGAALLPVDSSGAAARTYPVALALTLGRCAAKLQPGRPHPSTRTLNLTLSPSSPSNGLLMEMVLMLSTLIIQGAPAALDPFRSGVGGNTVFNTHAGCRLQDNRVIV